VYSLSDAVQLIKQAEKDAVFVRGHANKVAFVRKVLLKKADELTQSSEFEKAFGAVAYTYLQEKVPNLLPHIIGFQLIDRDDDTDTAAGVFIAQLGEKVIDVPMFFENNELKGQVLMRVREPEMFLPLREAFISYILSRMPQDLGMAIPESERTSKVPSQPTMQAMDPTTSATLGGPYKLASEDMAPWARSYNVLREFDRMGTDVGMLQDSVAVMTKKAQRRFCDLGQVISKSASFLRKAAQLADEYPSFGDGMNRIYGEDWLESSFRKLPAKKTAELRLPGELSLSFDEGHKKSAEYRRYTSLPHWLSGSKLEEAREELAKHGEYIDFNEEAVPEVEAVEINERIGLTPAPANGVYDVMKADGELERCVVLVSSTMPYPNVPNTDLIISTSGKKICFSDRLSYGTAVRLSQKFEERVELAKALETMSGEPSSGKIGFFVTKTQRVSPIVKLGDKLDDGYHDLRYFSSWSYESKSQSSHSEGTIPGKSADKLRLYEGDSDIRMTNDRTLLVPKDATFVVLAREESDYGESCCMPEREKIEKLELASAGNMTMREMIGSIRVKLQKLSSDRVVLNERPMSFAQARAHLVTQARLDKASADYFLGGSDGSTRRFIVIPSADQMTYAGIVKKAQAAYDEPYIPFPEMQSPQPGPTGNYQVAMPEEQVSQAPPGAERVPLQEGEEPVMPSGGAEWGAQEQAEQNGLWDVAGLVAIIRNANVSDDVRLATKSLLSTINKLGRQIFSFYSHKSEYSDAYGADELPDLEAMLLSAFETCGDLFIALLRKAPDAAVDMDASILSTGVDPA
jgi:hypothetical protein